MTNKQTKTGLFFCSNVSFCSWVRPLKGNFPSFTQLLSENPAGKYAAFCLLNLFPPEPWQRPNREWMFKLCCGAIWSGGIYAQGSEKKVGGSSSKHTQASLLWQVGMRGGRLKVRDYGRRMRHVFDFLKRKEQRWAGILIIFDLVKPTHNKFLCSSRLLKLWDFCFTFLIFRKYYSKFVLLVKLCKQLSITEKMLDDLLQN